MRQSSARRQNNNPVKPTKETKNTQEENQETKKAYIEKNVRNMLKATYRK